MARILVIDDCVDTRTCIIDFLDTIGFIVVAANNDRAGLVAIEDSHYDLIILDLMLPQVDRLNICRVIRSKKPYTPILILSGWDNVAERVDCFDAGADEYLIKPFNCQELRARVNALLRLVEAYKTPTDVPLHEVQQIGSLLLDRENHGVIRNGRLTRLTKREMAVLLFFTQMPGKIVTRGELLKRVWGYNNDCYLHAVDTLINRLRGKIEENPTKPGILLTVWGAGYTLNAG